MPHPRLTDRHRRGLSTIYFLLALPSLLIFTWLGVEIGLVVRAAGHAKIASDAIALAAASRAFEGFEVSRSDAFLAASINRSPNGPVVVSMPEDNSGDVKRGVWNSATRTFLPAPESIRAFEATVTFGPGNANGSPGVILPGIFRLIDYDLVRSSVAIPLSLVDGPSVGIAGLGLRMSGSSVLRSAGYVDISLAQSGVLDLRGESLVDTPRLRSDIVVPDQAADAVSGDIESSTTLFTDPYLILPAPEPQETIISSGEAGSVTLSPGLHPDGLEVVNRRVTLAPGLHQFAGDGLAILGGGTVVLDRATVQLMDPASVLNLEGNGRLEGRAMTDGPWADVAVLTPIDGAPWLLKQDSRIDVRGDVYAPNRDLLVRDRARITSGAAILAGLDLDQQAIIEFEGGILPGDERGRSARLVR